MLIERISTLQSSGREFRLRTLLTRQECSAHLTLPQLSSSCGECLAVAGIVLDGATGQGPEPLRSAASWPCGGEQPKSGHLLFDASTFAA
jgi:hypothetical protein